MLVLDAIREQQRVGSERASLVDEGSRDSGDHVRRLQMLDMASSQVLWITQ